MEIIHCDIVVAMDAIFTMGHETLRELTDEERSAQIGFASRFKECYENSNFSIGNYFEKKSTNKGFFGCFLKKWNGGNPTKQAKYKNRKGVWIPN